MRHYATLAGLATLLALSTPLQAAGAQAARAPMLLRYRFVAGQTLTYRLALTDTEQQTLSGKVTRNKQTFTALAHYQFRTVAKDGKAHLVIHLTQQARTTSSGGKPHPATPPVPDVDTQQWPDGTQVNSASLTRGGYGAGDIGILSDVPVGVGSHWSSSLDKQPGLNQTLHCTNTVSALRSTRAGLVATIVVEGAFTGVGQSDQINGHFRGTTHERLQSTWQFNATSGRFVSGEGRYTIVETGTLTVGTKAHPVRTLVSYQFAMKPVGAQ